MDRKATVSDSSSKVQGLGQRAQGSSKTGLSAYMSSMSGRAADLHGIVVGHMISPILLPCARICAFLCMLVCARRQELREENFKALSFGLGFPAVAVLPLHLGVGSVFAVRACWFEEARMPALCRGV